MIARNQLDTNTNFWEANPNLTLAGEFKTLYKSDRTVGKNFSSKLMWTIALIWSRKSEYYSIPEEGKDNKVDLLFEDFFGDKNYYKKNKESVNKLRDFYLSFFETEAERTLRGLEAKLAERDAFLRTTPYELGEKGDRGYVYGTVDTLDKMMANSKKLYEQFQEVRKMVLQEQDADSARGDVQESLSEKGDI